MKKYIHGLTGATVATLLTGAVGVAETSGERPNVLMLVIDDLNDWAGALHGHPDTLTPNIDRLARQGVVFTDAYATSPICGPSRAAFLSGMLASTSGLHDNTSRFDAHPILMENENLPQFFRNRGYLTFGSGKIFHYYYPQFWDKSLDKGPRMYRSGQPKLNGLEIPGIFDWGSLAGVTDEEMDDYKMAQFAIDRINETHDAPFFITCGIYLPHLPWYAPPEYFEPFPLDTILMPVVNPHETEDLPRTALSMIHNSYQQIVRELGPEAHREAVQAYLAATHFADAQIGRVLDALEASPYRHNTIVVLLSDNGNHHGQKDRWHKDTLWRESTRVPLIIYAPGMEGNGRPSHAVASLIDVYPTLVDLLGEARPSHLEGRSLKPLLEEPEREWDHAVISNRRPGQYAVRTTDWCYIRYHDGSEELYKRRDDPREWINLADIPQYDRIRRAMAVEIPE